MMKKILAVLMAVCMIGITAVAADTTTKEIILPTGAHATVVPPQEIPDAEGMFVLNSNWPTVYLKLDTNCRNGDHIKYNIRSRPVNTTGDGEIIDTIWADGVHGLIDSMRMYAISNKINLFWSYDNFGQYNGHFEKTCK